MIFDQPNQVQRPINTYPKWKYFVIVMVIAIAALYALPNIFGENPAVQLTGLRDTEVTSDQLKSVEEKWQQENLNLIAIEQQNNQKVVARFSDIDSQLKAQKSANDLLNPDSKNADYVVAQNLAPATPDWLSGLGGKPMKLGLDLRGGIYFLMQVDMDKAIEKQIEQISSDFKRTLLDDDEGRIRGRIETIENGVLLQVKPKDIERAYGNLYQAYQDRVLLERITRNGIDLIRATFTPTRLQEISDAAVDQNRLILSERVNSLGVAEPQIQRQGADRIVVQLPGVQDSALAKQVLGATATLEFRLVNEEAMAGFTAGQRPPAGTTEFADENGFPILIYDEVKVTGEHLIDSFPGQHPENQQPIVNVKLDSIGGGKMLETTVKNVGNRLAMILVESQPEFEIIDGERKLVGSNQKERVISAPNINGQFSTDFYITGQFTPAETKDLALNLRSGALVAPTFFIEERTVGPTLGAENIEKGMTSVIIGFALVLIFMLVYYKLFGFVANIALTLNLVLITAIMSILGATLTLPGIAGIVLTVGMAVDANVLIFERIREELRAGTKPAQAIDKGYAQALSTIADANITTMIAAIILYAIGTGPVKGFAITLFVGILTSMFTAIFVSRGIVNLIYGGKAVNKISI
ncbi:protein translocase subunit SecD [Kangiella sp. HZ709]|uniref:protein translocase subunit SecD n=1 Tax=Kangiella sp. HZ709 TaxID=2666328 RepID=UPI0012B1151B|nr:protein translocase subunit SecD [Kangiella sp. HZ709]MRX27010.1 protein translocase subunit SecD [Kangiella sp. HZ709]